MLYKCWDYLPRIWKKFVPPATNLNDAFQVLGRGYYIGYSIALLGLDLNDTECEKKYMQVYNLARKENVPPDMVKPGVLFAAGALASPHWNSPAIKPADRNVQHLLKRHALEIDSVQSLINNEAHELHFQVLLRHKMRLITVYKAILVEEFGRQMIDAGGGASCRV